MSDLSFQGRSKIIWRDSRLRIKGPATRNDFVNDIVNDARAGVIFATLKAIVDDEKSTISSTISLRVAWPLKLSYVHCVQLFSEVEIVYTHAY